MAAGNGVKTFLKQENDDPDIIIIYLLVNLSLFLIIVFNENISILYYNYFI